MGPLELRRAISGAAREVAALNKHVAAKRPEFADLGPDLDARGTANAACPFSPGMTVSPETAAALTNVASAEERVCRAYLSKKERQKIRRDVEVGQSRANEVLHVCGLRKRPVYWEIFGGSMLMSRIAAKRGWEVIQPVDYGTGLFVGRGGRDRRRRRGRRGRRPLARRGGDGQEEAIWETMRERRPDFVTLAPDCGPHSALALLRQGPRVDPRTRRRRRAKLRKKVREAEPGWLFARDAFEERRNDGLLTLVENPHVSRGWDEYYRKYQSRRVVRARRKRQLR